MAMRRTTIRMGEENDIVMWRIVRVESVEGPQVPRRAEDKDGQQGESWNIGKGYQRGVQWHGFSDV
jgi:hypothetical protein